MIIRCRYAITKKWVLPECSEPTTFAPRKQIEKRMKSIRITALSIFASAVGTFPSMAQFSIGGYGEAVMTRNFYSDNIYRYARPYEHKDDDSHGRFDLPHVVINMGYDFGHGWTMGMEIEMEHGGSGGAVEMDADESGEYEAEVEKGGEVALEQFWINYAFNPTLNLRMGEIIVPVGAANAYHMPNEFFTVYRPEGESTLFPNTWHQVGLSLWGRTSDFRYEMQFLSGLDSERFGAESFVHYGATTPYEFKIANSYAAAGRLDWYALQQQNQRLRLSLSGYYGHTFSNTLRSIGTAYSDVKGALAIGAFDFQYSWPQRLMVRGNIDYAHLGDAARITSFNKSFPTHSGQDGSPSKHQPVAKNALCYALEAGYNILSITAEEQSSTLYLFGRYEYYNSMQSSTQQSAYGWCGKRRWAVGINYSPVSQVIVKAEYSHRSFDGTGLTYTSSSGQTFPLEYNNEPSISIGVTYCGWFK